MLRRSIFEVLVGVRVASRQLGERFALRDEAAFAGRE
jgi:hypothetical protein